MSDIRWIKLRVDLFDDEKIKIIQSMPEGDAILVIWIRLIALAGKCNQNGLVLVEEEFPYTEEMLAVIFNKPLNTVRLALQTFERFKMLESTEKGFFITSFSRDQNTDGMDKVREQNRLRKQREREMKKSMGIGAGNPAPALVCQDASSPSNDSSCCNPSETIQGNEEAFVDENHINHTAQENIACADCNKSDCNDCEISQSVLCDGCEADCDTCEVYQEYFGDNCVTSQTLSRDVSRDCHVTSQKMSRDVTQQNKNKSKKKNINTFSDENVVENGQAVSTRATPLDYDLIVHDFNSTCVSLPRIRALSDARKAKLPALLNELDKLKLMPDTLPYERMHNIFKLAEESDFLSGRSGAWNNCSFDWLLNKTNVLKLIEGNYRNRGGGRNERSNHAEQPVYANEADSFTQSALERYRRAKANGQCV